MFKGLINIGKTPAHGKVRLCMVTLLCTLGGASNASSQGEGARAAAMGCSMTAVRQNPWAPFVNPAQTGEAQRWVAFTYAPAPYGLSELKSGAAVAGCEIGGLSLSFHARAEGFDLYHETRFGLGCSVPVGEDLRVGMNAAWESIGIKRYGETGVPCFDAGVVLRLTEALSAGASAHCINQPAIGTVVRERRPMRMAVGLAWMPDGGLMVCVNASREQRYDWVAGLGIEYRLFDVLAFRAGASTDPARISAGIGIAIHGISVHYAYLDHADLGGTHTLSFETSLPQLGL
jgi:hypothetical protein